MLVRAAHRQRHDKRATRAQHAYACGDARRSRAVLPRPSTCATAGAACFAVDQVMSGAARNAFCCVRPPGHHAGVEGLMADAEKDSSCGFCIFNSVAIAALHAVTTRKAVRCRAPPPPPCSRLLFYS